MAAPDPRDVPDLDLPLPRASAADPSATSARPKPALADDAGALGGDLGPALERSATSTPPTSRASSSRQIAIAIADDDDFGMGMEIERGGAMTSLTPTSSARPSGAATSAPPGGSGRPRADVSGLDVAYRRLDARPVEVGPSLGERIAGWTIPLVLLVGTIALLVKVAHQPGGRSVLRLLPHAFDASSTIQSGAAAIGALIGAIAIGFIGVKATPRSYAMIGSAAALLVASLAMVTVTLVSTDEEPIPPDGALLIPYVVPLAIFLLGLGVAGRGPSLFFGGGARRLGAALAGSLGGALVFAAIELSAIAARLP